MIDIRPIWSDVVRDRGHLSAEVTHLLEVEQRIVRAAETYMSLLRIVCDTDYVDEQTPLLKSAHKDLIGGSEMARAGYLKQAYSLWRSWFEQSIFLLYFLEAPLHRAAWSVKAAVSQDDDPQYRLMLHQLLSNSSEKHPFALVYDERYTRLTAALKISNVPKAQRPIQRATRVLTTLSQGVHGTYQPQTAQNLDALCLQLGEHCKPVLESAEQVLCTLWALLATDLLALPEDVLVKLREGSVSADEVKEAGVDEAELVSAIAPYFSQVFPAPTQKNG